MISKLLLEWYRINKRDLPWRQTNDPYLIWVSEIILQQTRVIQGIDYYFRFIDRFPDICTLANADEDEVLKLWQGLGYYSRARNLHFAAKQIVEEYQGIIPDTYNNLIKLKGIGAYSASAIASFAYGSPYPVIDGNVYRVLARIFGIEIPINSSTAYRVFHKIATDIFDTQNSALHNQAIMEFGALYCVPSKPDCSNCPLRIHCFAFRESQVDKLPVKKPKSVVRNRYFNYLFVENEGTTYIRKRCEKDIWRNLYEFPLIETLAEERDTEIIKKLIEKFHFKENTEYLPYINSIQNYKHQLSHQQLHIRFFHISLSNTNFGFEDLVQIPVYDLHKYAVPRIIDKYLNEIQLAQSSD